MYEDDHLEMAFEDKVSQEFATQSTLLRLGWDDDYDNEFYDDDDFDREGEEF